MSDNQLRGIANLIRQRQIADARRALGQYLKAHPDSAEAWYLRSVVEADADGRVRAAQKASSLDQSNAKYGERLARLIAAAPKKSRSRVGRRWWLLPLVLFLIAGGLLLVASQISQPAIIMPTEAVFALSELRTPTEAPRATNIIVPTDTPVVTIPPSATPEPVMPTSTLEPETTLTQAITVVVAPTNSIAAPVVNPAVNIPPTNTPANAVPTMIVVGAIPLLEGANVGGGELRVVDVVRQASAEIAERGGSVPPAPDGQDWVLLELLLICEDGTNCAPDTGAFKLTGNFGTPYSLTAGFQLDPVFGREAFAAGQVWGYLGFVVPNSESGLWLTLGQGSDIYRFALQ
jgi:hypothetical protein